MKNDSNETISSFGKSCEERIADAVKRHKDESRTFFSSFGRSCEERTADAVTYNVKFEKFLDSSCISVYKAPIVKSGMTMSCDEYGVIHERKIFEQNIHEYKGEWVETPFSDLPEWIIDMNRLDKQMEEQRRKAEERKKDEEERKKESLRVARVRAKKKISDFARCNHWDWFFTFTFDKEKIDRYDYDVVSEALQNWLSNIRRIAPNIRYLIVPEQHKDGAWHFHGLFADCQGLTFRFGKFKRGERIYNVESYHLGWTTATKVKDSKRVQFYITKYITKDVVSVTKGKHRYWASRNLATPEVEVVYLDGMALSMFCEEWKKDGKVFQIDGLYQSVTKYDFNFLNPPFPDWEGVVSV